MEMPSQRRGNCHRDSRGISRKMASMRAVAVPEPDVPQLAEVPGPATEPARDLTTPAPDVGRFRALERLGL